MNLSTKSSRFSRNFVFSSSVILPSVTSWLTLLVTTSLTTATRFSFVIPFDSANSSSDFPSFLAFWKSSTVRFSFVSTSSINPFSSKKNPLPNGGSPGGISPSPFPNGGVFVIKSSILVSRSERKFAFSVSVIFPSLSSSSSFSVITSLNV